MGAMYRVATQSSLPLRGNRSRAKRDRRLSQGATTSRQQKLLCSSKATEAPKWLSDCEEKKVLHAGRAPACWCSSLLDEGKQED